MAPQAGVLLEQLVQGDPAWLVRALGVAIGEIGDGHIELINREELRLQYAVPQEESDLVSQTTFQDDVHDVLRGHGGDVEVWHIIQDALVIDSGLNEGHIGS